MWLKGILEWFSGGDVQYMDTVHCMQGDTFWIWVTIILHLSVFFGYMLIAAHWYRSQKELKACVAKNAICQMVGIFFFCGLCGYLMLVVRMFWPAWRLTDIITLALLWYTMRYILNTNGLVAVYTQMGRADQLQLDLDSLKAISDNVPHITWSADRKGDIDYVNYQWTALTGMTLEQSKGSGWKSAVYPDDLLKTIVTWDECMAKGTIFQAEYRLRAADGTFRWFLGRAVPLRGADGSVKKWYGSCADIETQKAVQEKLEKEKDSLARLRQLTEAMNAPASTPPVKKNPTRKTKKSSNNKK